MSVRSAGEKEMSALRDAAGIEHKHNTKPVFVVECDAIDLPTFRSDMERVIPERNLHVARGVVENVNSAMGGSWYGGIRNFTEAEELLTKGYPEGAEMASKLADEIMPFLPPPESLRRSVRWADDGGELDYDKMRSSGIETAFRSTRQKRQRGPRVIRLAGSWDIPGVYGGENIKWNGAGMLAAVDLLEKSDFRVELSLALTSNHGFGGQGHYSMTVVRVKAANEPLNPSTVAGICGHAGTYRSLGFLTICASAYGVDSGLGGSVIMQTVWEQAVAAGVLEKADAYMEIAGSKGGAMRNCVAILRQALSYDEQFQEELNGLEAKIAGLK